MLVTPICRRYFRDGVLLSSHDDYPDAIRTLAKMKGVPLIDIYALSYQHVAALGDEESRKLYMWVEEGVYPAYPKGNRDDTHTQRQGAETFARMVAEKLRELQLVG